VAVRHSDTQNGRVESVRLKQLSVFRYLRQPQDQIIFPKGEFWSDEPTWESNLHLTQIILLIKCLEWLWQDREDYFGTWNLTIYYSPNQKKSEYFRGSDFFVVLGTTRNQNRKSWVVWQEEGKYRLS